MRKKKLLTAVISLALVISMVLPGTLAVSNGQDSSDAPVETTTAAVDPAPDAAKPGETKTEAGTTEDPSQPTEDPSQPSEDPSRPTEDPSQPTEDPSQPTEDPSQPTEDPVQPTEDPSQPTEDPSQPTEDPSQPTEDPPQPSEDPENTEDPEDPEQEAADYTDLFNRFMAAQTYEAFDAIYQELSEEDRTAFAAWLTENGKMEELQAHFSDLYIVDEPQEEEQPIVPFTNVGPLLAAPAARPRMLKAPSNAKDDSGIVLNKTAVYNKEDGSYTITLEAYATGESTTTVKEQPVDIVLVLDVSGSMDDFFGTPTKVYAGNLDRSKTYYIAVDGDGYIAVTWNDSENSWGYYYSGLFGGTYWNGVTPKSSNYDERREAQFYTVQKKVDALKSAVNGFIDSVATKSPTSNIAIVKFAGDKSSGFGNGTYRDGKYTYNHSQIVKRLTAAGTGKDELKTAVSALKPAGATAADYGMQHAQSIINGAANDGYKKVVIMFTDGEPNHYSGFDGDVANAAISASKGIKDDGATVYTIGVFSGADGTPVADINSVRSDTNKYMHLVSSNYPEATNMDNPGTAKYPENNKSYFLSPSNAGELNSIFQSITEEIGTTTSLDETATIKDIVSPYFTMPAEAKDVTVKTAESDGSTDTWKTAEDFKGTVTIENTSSTVSVSGFSFKDNWCGNHKDASGNTTFHDGKKLIIQFTVRPKENFLGGNDVPTNGTDSGIYDKDGTAVRKFKVPEVNVPIEEVTVTAKDKNVYLLGSLTAEQIKSGATAKVGDVELDLTKADYGLADWQTEHVTIAVTCTDAEGKTVTGINNLVADTTYIVTVTVTPNKTGTTTAEKGTAATKQFDSATGNIYVFKPELTYKDSTAYYGETAPGFDGNLTNTVWKHGATKSTDAGVTMQGDAPELGLTYIPETGKIANGKINTKQDIVVDVTVKINNVDVTDETSFVHTKCAGDTACTDPENGKFWIHVKTCTLTIIKAGGADDESYVFTVYKDGTKYSEVTVWGNSSQTLYELPVGKYTIEEDMGWSWRYEERKGNCTLSAENPDWNVQINNSKTKDTWLNGFSAVVRNIFDRKH